MTQTDPRSQMCESPRTNALYADWCDDKADITEWIALCQTLERELAEARKALAELVRLKGLKDQQWRTNEEKLDSERSKPIAWANARAALEASHEAT